MRRQGAGVLTIGEQRVRLSFNPDCNENVDRIKRKAADLIDLCEMLKSKDERLSSIAQIFFEDGAMWAVKAATS